VSLAKSMNRDKAIKYFKIAKYKARLLSKDPNTQVGALYLAPNTLHILSAGYNGFCRGIDDTKPSRWERPMKYNYVCHAEANGIYNACRRGVSLENSIAVTTLFPCQECAKAIIQVGVDTIVTLPPDFEDPKWGDQFKTSMDMFKEVGMKIVLLDEEDLVEEDT
jgi:dCMP deaminase